MTQSAQTSQVVELNPLFFKLMCNLHEESHPMHRTANIRNDLSAFGTSTTWFKSYTAYETLHRIKGSLFLIKWNTRFHILMYSRIITFYIHYGPTGEAEHSCHRSHATHQHTIIRLCVLTTHTFTDFNHTYGLCATLCTYTHTQTRIHLFTDVAWHREVAEPRGSSWSTRLIEFSRQSGVAVIRSRKTEENWRRWTRVRVLLHRTCKMVGRSRRSRVVVVVFVLRSRIPLHNSRSVRLRSLVTAVGSAPLDPHTFPFPLATSEPLFPPFPRPQHAQLCTTQPAVEGFVRTLHFGPLVSRTCLLFSWLERPAAFSLFFSHSVSISTLPLPLLFLRFPPPPPILPIPVGSQSPPSSTSWRPAEPVKCRM